MRRYVVVFAALMLLLGAACGDDDNGDGDTGTQKTQGEGDQEGTGGGTVTFTAVDFAFQAPASVPAGETEITLTNEGKEPHQLLMSLLTEDAPDVEKLLELPQKKAESYFAEEYNQLEKPIKPGESASATVDLKPGTYAYVCFIESKKEKAPHAFLGMVGQLTVE